MKTCPVHETPLNGAGNCFICQHPEEHEAKPMTPEEFARRLKSSEGRYFEYMIEARDELIRREAKREIIEAVCNEIDRLATRTSATGWGDIKPAIRAIPIDTPPAADRADYGHKAMMEASERVNQATCSRCEGSGLVVFDTLCPDCHGTGKAAAPKGESA